MNKELDPSIEEFFSDNAGSHLIDELTETIYVDPVVLRSGRTISAPFLAENKGKDPFTQEFVKKEDIIPNKDKVKEIELFLETQISNFLKEVGNTTASQLLTFLRCIANRNDLSSCVNGRRLAIDSIQKEFTKISGLVEEIVKVNSTFFFDILLSSRWEPEKGASIIEKILDNPNLLSVFPKDVPFLDKLIGSLNSGTELQKTLVLKLQALKPKPLKTSSQPITPDESAPGVWALWVGGLPDGVTEEELEEEFGIFGPIKSVKIVRDKHFGYVNYIHREDATDAINSKGVSLGEHKLKLKTAIFRALEAAPPRAFSPPPVKEVPSPAPVVKEASTSLPIIVPVSVKEAQVELNPLYIHFLQKKGGNIIQSIESQLKAKVSIENNTLVLRGPTAEEVREKVPQIIKKFFKDWKEISLEVSQELTTLFKKKVAQVVDDSKVLMRFQGNSVLLCALSEDESNAVVHVLRSLNDSLKKVTTKLDSDICGNVLNGIKSKKIDLNAIQNAYSVSITIIAKDSLIQIVGFSSDSIESAVKCLTGESNLKIAINDGKSEMESQETIQLSEPEISYLKLTVQIPKYCATLDISGLKIDEDARAVILTGEKSKLGAAKESIKKSVLNSVGKIFPIIYSEPSDLARATSLVAAERKSLEKDFPGLNVHKAESIVDRGCLEIGLIAPNVDILEKGATRIRELCRLPKAEIKLGDEYDEFLKKYHSAKGSKTKNVDVRFISASKTIRICGSYQFQVDLAKREILMKIESMGNATQLIDFDFKYLNQVFEILGSKFKELETKYGVTIALSKKKIKVEGKFSAKVKEATTEAKAAVESCLKILNS